MEVATGYKLSEVGTIPHDWNVFLLQSFTTITRLAGAEYSSVWVETPDGEIIALRGFNIGRNVIIERDLVRISNQLSLKLKRSRLKKGDVVYPCVGTIGNAVVIEEDDKYHIQQNIARIIPDSKKVSSYYLAHYLMSHLGLNEVMKFNATSSQPNVLVGSLRLYSIALPPTIEEQTAIATALSDADALICSLEKLIAKKRNIKQGAMQQLLQPKEGWEVKKLGEVGECLRGVSYNPTSDLFENDTIHSVRLFRSNNVQNDLIDLNGLQYVHRYKVKEMQFLRSNDIVICMANGSKQLVGKSALFVKPDSHDYTFGAFMGCFRTNVALADNKFISLNFLTHNYRTYIDVLLSGSSINNLKPSDIESIEIPFPEKNEQAKIASILSDMDSEIAALETKLEKHKQLKQGMMQQLLTGKIRLV